MKIIWWETCLVILIPLFLLLLWTSYRLYTVPKLSPDHNPNDIISQLQTGDLVFVRYDSKYGTLIRVVTGADWSHVACVLREEDRVFLVEVADYTGYEEPNVEDLEGLCIVPLEQWLQLNEERICGYRKYTGSRPQESDIRKLLQQYQNINLDMDLFNWTSILYRRKNTHKQKDNYFCSEFIALLLQELGILSDEINPGYYSPTNLATMDIPAYNKIQTFYLEEY